MESTELVRRVVDGDTFETASMGGPVRLLNVNASAIHDHLGREARRHLAQLLASRAVQVDFVDYDRYGRRLAWVECGGRLVNHAMNEYLAKHGCSTRPTRLRRGDHWPL